MGVWFQEIMDYLRITDNDGILNDPKLKEELPVNVDFTYRLLYKVFFVLFLSVTLSLDSLN